MGRELSFEIPLDYVLDEIFCAISWILEMGQKWIIHKCGPIVENV